MQQIFGTGTSVPTTLDDSERHTFGIDIRMMHLSGKDIFNVWDFAGQVSRLHLIYMYIDPACVYILYVCKAEMLF